MIICGIDPGYDRAGYAFLQVENNKVSVSAYGLVSTSKNADFSSRFLELGKDFQDLFDRYKPDYLYIEKLFMGRNTTTVLPVAEIRGLLRYLAGLRSIPFYEIAPKTVKKNVSGYGNADKNQMIRAVTLLLNLSEAPKSDDAADALAIAFCGFLQRPMTL